MSLMAFFRAVLCAEVSWMRSGTYLSQFLRVFIPNLDLKFRRLVSYVMKICMCYFFVSSISGGVNALADFDFVPAIPATTLIDLI